MVKALVLDIRINSAQHVVVGTLTLIVLLVCAAFGVLTPFWLFVAMWLGGLSAAHRDLRRLATSLDCRACSACPARRRSGPAT